MLRKYILALLLSLCASLSWSQDKVVILCYHDIVNNFREANDPDALELPYFLAHLEWLEKEGFVPVTVDQLEANRLNDTPLPEKSYLLTFDDGYLSFYEKVFPVLKEKKIPAVLALVGSWIDAPAGSSVIYDNTPYPREKFVSRTQIQEMARSGLVEFASHSYDLHKGVPSNPQGNTIPAAVTRQYFSETQSYESDVAYQTRIASDLAKNSQLLESITGKKPRIIVWPYGRHSGETLDIAKKGGMSISFNLEDGIAKPKLHTKGYPRQFMRYNATLSDLKYAVYPEPERLIERIMHLDLDYVYDLDPAQIEKNLSAMLDRVKDSGATTVYLQAYADEEGHGGVSQLYFPNRHLPVKADLLNRVSWQLSTRAGVKVYAWMPVLAYKLGNLPLVKTEIGKEVQGAYPRLSPFSSEVKKVIGEIYEDLGKSAQVKGILFHDDATLSDWEDMSDDALAYYKSKGLPALAEIRESPELRQEWSRLKSGYLTDFTKYLWERAGYYKQDLKTARNIYAQVILNEKSEEWFGQNLNEFLNTYDFTAIMAMPYMEKMDDQDFFAQLYKALQGKNKQKIVNEFQAVDWNTQEPVSTEKLVEWMRLSKRNGIVSFGYYPDNFIKQIPYLPLLKPHFSRQQLLEKRLE